MIFGDALTLTDDLAVLRQLSVFSAVRWALTQFETEIADELLGTYGGPRRPDEDGEAV
jgi:hypothetical protein